MIHLLPLILLFSFHTAQGKTLTEQLQERGDASASRSSEEKKKIQRDAIEDLRKTKILETAKKKGDAAPGFRLPDFQRGMISSKDLLKKGPILLVFYRGGWCPYCNLQLRDLQKHLPQIQKAGAQLVAISPETPEASKATATKQEVDYYVLSDEGATVGKAFGLMYQIPENLNTLYKGFGIDLKKSNGDSKRNLPIAATYIIGQDGEIKYSFLNVDYKKRAETTDVIAELKKMKN